jgi:hypothetical protein
MKRSMCVSVAIVAFMSAFSLIGSHHVAADQERKSTVLAGCFHGNGAGWRFTVCLRQDGWVGFTGTAFWKGKLPGALRKELQGGNGLAKSPNPSPVLGLYGPAADTIDYELAIGFSSNRFLLYYVRTCVPDCASGGGNYALYPGWTPNNGAAGIIRLYRGR